MFDRITVIVNPIAGGRGNRRPGIEYIIDYFTQEGSTVDLNTTTRCGEATEFAESAVQRNANLLLVAGGDGTVNEVASALVGTDVPLGIIPMGSGNGLARSLGVPKNIDGACALITRGSVSSIDVGRANDRYFFLVAGVGFDAVVGRRFEESARRGPLPYFFLGAKEYLTYRPAHLKINFDCRSLDSYPFLVAVANGPQYGNNAIVAPDAKLNDGLLDICIIHKLPVLQLFSALPKLFNGRLKNYSGAEFYQSKNVTLERNCDDYLNLDGETVLEKAVVNISIMPKSLKVVAPPDSPSLAR